MKKRLRSKLLLLPNLLLFIFLLISFLASGQTEERSSRPKLGLALSGGGAKGLAHIGVIEVMEKAGLKPDYITGTSMGSLVGALYALGYTPDQMRALVDSLNWDNILSNSIPWDEVAIEQKPFYNRYIAVLPYEEGKISIPKGLIEGQKLGELFENITRPAHGIDDFSQFPIPFKCIAADITTGEAIELSSGQLSEAMRASMAIPSIFTPVEYGDRLLVDGGLIRNFPVENVKNMGADLVIGVYVSDDLYSKDELNNMVDVLGQSAFIMSTFDSREQKELTDILIEPDLEGYGTASFNDYDSIISRGLKAGNEFYGVFKNLADSLDRFGKKEPIPPVELKDKFLISSVDFQGNQVYDEKKLIKRFGLSLNDSVSIFEIEKKVDAVFGSGRFEKVGYSLDPQQNKLTIQVNEAPKGSLKLAAHYDSENLAGVNLNFTLREFLFKESRSILEIDLAQNPWFDGSYLKYFGKSYKLALIGGFHLSQQDLPLYVDQDFIAGVFNNFYQKYYLQLQSTTSQKFAVGGQLFLENAIYKPKIGEILNVIFERARNYNYGANLFVEKNTLNKRYYPTRGSKGEIKYTTHFYKNTNIKGSDNVFNEESTFQSLSLDYTIYGKLAPKLTWFSRNSLWLSTTPSSSINLIDYRFIGGFIPRYQNASEYWGGDIYEFPVNNAFYSKLGLQWEVINNLYLITVANYIDVEYPRAFFEENPDILLLGDYKRRAGFGAAVAFNSIIGPIQFNIAKDIYRKKWASSIILGFYL